MTPPRATYRLQLHRDFPFEAAEDIMEYLRQLGIDTLYLSPVLKARPGSTHGYDVTDPTAINPELGTRAALQHLLDSLASSQMGVIFDVVPNHMAADRDNPWWWDVLSRGIASPFAPFFDIDWDSPYAHGKVLLPLLGRPFADELESGTLQIALIRTGFVLTYYDKAFPLALPSWRPILTRTILLLRNRADQRRSRHELFTLWRRLTYQDNTNQPYPSDVLHRLMTQNPAVKSAVGQALTYWNNRPGQPTTWNALEKILSVQHWRLTHYRMASREGNYRRFFDINELPTLRIEQPSVFTAVHSTLLSLSQHPAVYGFRIDHIDGLYDPERYLSALSSVTTQAPSQGYLLVEKILNPHEDLPDNWPVAGTTGYDFLNIAMTTLLDPDGLTSLTTIYSSWHNPDHTQNLIQIAKEYVLAELFASDLDRLCRLLLPIAARDRQARDLTQLEIHDAVAALTVALPVYRTYLGSNGLSPRDGRVLHNALHSAKAHHPTLPPMAWAFLEGVVFGFDNPSLSPEERHARQDWVMRWQQLTGPVHAKGFEDTTLYRYHRLTSLNEVGGDLFTQGLPPASFHQAMALRLTKTPQGLNTTSTHDTKRSEDVRARLGILSEIPVIWKTAVDDWHARIRPFFERQGELTVPDPSTEYLLFQSIVGAFPLDPSAMPHFPQRIKTYIQKAVREAKVHSSWTDPNLSYEAALYRLVDVIFHHQNILDAMQPLIRLVAYYGALSSLSQVLLKTFAPGVPDFYQGSELWDFSLTDPDNRRPVDFSRHQHLLAQMMASSPSPSDLLSHWDDGRIKLYITHHALQVRLRNMALFQHGAYHGLEVQGPQADHVLAFARHYQDQWCLVVVPRRYARLTLVPQCMSMVLRTENVWDTTALILPSGIPHRWHDALSNQTLSADTNAIPLSEIFATLPMSVLQPEDI